MNVQQKFSECITATTEVYQSVIAKQLERIIQNILKLNMNCGNGMYFALDALRLAVLPLLFTKCWHNFVSGKSMILRFGDTELAPKPELLRVE